MNMMMIFVFKQGSCVYTLTKTCPNSAAMLKNFSVEIQAENRNPDKPVTVTKWAQLRAYGQTVRIDKGKKVFVSKLL